MYAADGQFICKDCARANGNICECGNFKKEGYETCYECKEDLLDDNPILGK